MLNSLSKRFFDPCLELRSTTGSTMGKVLTKVVSDPFDHGEVEFRGEVVSATFAHPEINVGQLVNMIEKPRGRWFATCLQQSWYMAPIADLIKAGRRAQAAMTWLMRDNPKYWPEVIMIDKRGQPGDDQGGDDGGSGTGTDDGSKVGPDGWNDWNDDGFMSPDEWAMAGHNPADFAAADANGDGKISPEEYAAWLTRGMSDHLDPDLLAYLLQYSWVGLYEYNTGKAAFGVSFANQSIGGLIHHSSLAFSDFSFYGIYTSFIGSPVRTFGTSAAYDIGGGRSRRYLIGAYNLGSPFECNFSAGLSYYQGASVSGDPSNPDWDDYVQEAYDMTVAGFSAMAEGGATISIIDHGAVTRYARLNPSITSSNKPYPGYVASISYFGGQTF